jgi:hypothetical protein
MRTKYTINADQSVTVTDRAGNRCTYWVQGSLGYVYWSDETGESHQVCEMLRDSGITLMSTPDDLPQTLRRELRKVRAARVAHMMSDDYMIGS